MKGRAPSSSFGAARLLLRCRRRIALRRLRERAYELMILAPLIVGAAVWVTARYLDILRPVLRGWLAVEALPVALPVALPALVLAFLVTPALWPGSLRELWGHAPLETLPVPEVSRLLVTLVTSAARALVPTALLASALGVLAGRWPTLAEAGLLFLGCLLLVLLTVCLAAFLVHWRAASTESLLALAAFFGVLAFGPWPATRWALLPWGVAGAALQGALSTSLSTSHSTSHSTSLFGLLVTTVLVALVLAVGVLAAMHLAWRRRDLERSQAELSARGAGRLSTAGARAAHALQSFLGRHWPRPLVAMVWRDVRLVRRRFSPAVPLCAGLVLGFFAILLILALDPESLPAAVRGPAIALPAMVLAATLAVLSTVAVVPFLLRAQLPVFWLEKVTGVALDQVWRAKVLLSILLVLPVLVAGLALLATVAPGSAVERLIACSQLVATSVVVTSLISLACFEIATEPLIGLVWSGLVALALASLFVFYPQAWWLWGVAYFVVAGEVAKRASRRVHLTDVAT